MGIKRFTGRVSTAGMAAAFSVLVLGSFAGTTDAAPKWSPAERFDGYAGSAPEKIRSTYDEEGRRLIYWTAEVSGVERLLALRMSPEGNLGSVQTISGAAPWNGSGLRVGMAPDGTGTFAWVEPGLPNPAVKTVALPLAGPPAPAITRSPAGTPGQDLNQLSMDISADGTVGLAWRRLTGLLWQAQTMTVSPLGVVSGPHDITAYPIDADEPRIAALPGNLFRLAWIEHDLETGYYNVATRPLAQTGLPLVVNDVVKPVEYAFPRSKQEVDANCRSTGQTVPDGADFPPHQLELGTTSKNASFLVWRRRSLVKDVDPVRCLTTVRGFQWGIEISRILGDEEPKEERRGFLFPYALETPLNTDIYDYSVTMAPNRWNSQVDARNTASWQAITHGKVSTQIYRFAGGGIWHLSVKGPDEIDPVAAMGLDGTMAIAWTESGSLPGTSTVKFLRVSQFGAALPPEIPGFDDLKSTSAPVPIATGDGGVTYLFYGVDQDDEGGFWLTRYTDHQIRIQPSSLDFGSIQPGSESSTRRAYLSSPDGTATDVTAMSLTGPDANEFSIVNPNACIKGIVPGSSCEVQIDFRPGQTGSRNARLEVETEDGILVTDLAGRGVVRNTIALEVEKSRVSAKPGDPILVQAEVSNPGGAETGPVKVCLQVSRKAFTAGSSCTQLSPIASGQSRPLTFSTKLRKGAVPGRKHLLMVKAFAPNVLDKRQPVYVKVKKPGK